MKKNSTRKNTVKTRKKRSLRKWVIAVLIILAFMGYRIYGFIQCISDRGCVDYDVGFFDSSFDSSFSYTYKHSRAKYNWITGKCVKDDCCRNCYGKPIIYLYPEEITNVTVALGYPKKTTHTYPKYNEPWRVQAEPN